MVERKRVLVGCEFSGVVRDAFAARGWDSWSCDLLPSEKPGQHIIGDVFDAIQSLAPDLGIFHPPCTYLTVSGNKWMKPEFATRFPGRAEKREEALRFFLGLYNSPIPRVAVENPIGVVSTRFRKPNQIIQPWQFGHAETKATCLWLRGLPLLRPTNIVALPELESERMRLHYLPPSPTRWAERSRTFTGIAAAMAEQWG